MNTLFSFSVFLLNFRSIECSVCPEGFEEFSRKDGCVISIERELSYNQSRQECASRGAIPVKILNYFDNTFVQQIIQRNPNPTDHYIGLERQSNGLWLYADGSKSSYSNWAPKEPNSSPSSNCAVIDPSTQGGKWFAVDCVSARPFLCSRDEGDYVPTAMDPPSTTPYPGDCDPGWTYNRLTGFCYYVWFGSYIYWVDAETNCRIRNAHLVSIHSKEEDDFVKRLFQETAYQRGKEPCETTYAAIGLNGSGEVGNGAWTDGSPVDYSGWLSYPQTGAWTLWALRPYLPPVRALNRQELDEPYCYPNWRSFTDINGFDSYICKK